MRRALTTSSTRNKAIGELIDRLTGDIESSIDERARAIVSSWGSGGFQGLNGTNGHSRPRTRVSSYGAPPYAARGYSLSTPLPRAERDFRISYLRALLAEAPNRRDAARKAGVPYRTLCDMVRKLRIDA